MTMSPDRLAAQLTASLHQDIDGLGVMPESPIGRRTQRRLIDVAEHAPHFISLLVEPLLGDDADLSTLVQCARVHLYARVLDDALDENLPLDRRNLLRIQPLFWHSVYTLAGRYPVQSEASGLLMRDTIKAVELDDAQAHPGMWGQKNGHLLLAPLLLSGDSAAYRAAVPGLMALLAVAQACEELEQDRVRTSALRDDLATAVVKWLDAEMIATLHQHGWHGAAMRVLADGDMLLTRMRQLRLNP